MKHFSLPATLFLLAFFLTSQAYSTKQTPATRKASTASKTKKTTRLRHGKSTSKAKAATWRNRQVAPTADRYKEIQGALASKGYLKSTPSGTWDAESQDALKRFQADQNIQQTGKLNSISLIALGLGPAKPSASPAGLPGAVSAAETTAPAPLPAAAPSPDEPKQ